jgi:hypothetical protein
VLVGCGVSWKTRVDCKEHVRSDSRERTVLFAHKVACCHNPERLKIQRFAIVRICRHREGLTFIASVDLLTVTKRKSFLFAFTNVTDKVLYSDSRIQL